MSQQPATPGKHLSSSSPAKEGVGGTVYSMVVRVSELLQNATVMVENLKTNGAEHTSELKVLEDLTDGITQDLGNLGLGVRGVDEFMRDSSRSQAEILASVVETLLEVHDILQTVHHSLVGLTTSTHEHQCPWRKDGSTMTAEAMWEALETLAAVAPRIKEVVEDRLEAAGRDPETGKKLWWGRVFLDRVRDAVSSAFFSSLAVALIGLLAWIYFFGERSSLEKTRSTARQELEHKVVELEKQAVSDRVELQKYRDAEVQRKRHP